MRLTSNHWKLCLLLFPIIGTCVLASPGGQLGFFKSYYGATFVSAAFSPTDIANLGQWIDFSDTTTLFTDTAGTSQAGDTDNIARANDKSGNGRDFVQATSANRFQLQANTQNGLFAAYSENVDFMSLTNGLDLARNVSGFTIFIVKKYDTFANFSTPYGIATPSGAARILSPRYNAGSLNFGGRRLDADSFLNANGSAASTGTVYLMHANYDYQNASWVMYKDNVSDATITPGTSGNSSDTDSSFVEIGRFGANSVFYFTGYIYEVIAYQRSLTTDEMTQVYNYLANKWGL